MKAANMVKAVTALGLRAYVENETSTLEEGVVGLVDDPNIKIMVGFGFYYVAFMLFGKETKLPSRLSLSYLLNDINTFRQTVEEDLAA